MQEAFVKIWHGAGRFRAERGSAQGWLVSIARNQAIDLLRAPRAPARDIAEMHELADPGPGPEAARSAADDRRRIERCLETLPKDRARAVRAAYVEGWSYDELARHFDVPLEHDADLAAAGADQPQGVPRAMIDAPLETPEERDAALAGEYVLRLLPPEEAAACAAREATDPRFAAQVAVWRADLEGLDGAFAEAAPPAGLERRIEARLFGREPSGLARLWASVGLWRAVAAAAVLAALWVGVLAPPPGCRRRLVSPSPRSTATWRSSRFYEPQAAISSSTAPRAHWHPGGRSSSG